MLIVLHTIKKGKYMEDQDCGVCGDSNAERVNEKEYGYKYLCSRCQRDNDPDYCERDFFNF
jgi:hypothetical protein